MSTLKLDGWYQKKLYAHFDTPLEFEEAEQYVTDPDRIAKHSFLPFLSFELKKRRIHKEPKSRPIKYASHVDGYIFSYYAKILAEAYEGRLLAAGLNEAVLAYRPGRGNNITFAKEAFGHIVDRGTCVALGFDISSFFDNIDHTQLKRQWSDLLGQRQLPADHYAVFRALTKYSFVDRDQCYGRLGYSRARIERGGRICTIRDFREKIRSRDGNLLQINNADHGIPQGSALSAVLANVYMYPFDQEMQRLALDIGGVYRRYSDDILFIVPLEREGLVRDAVVRSLARLGDRLMIQDDKTLATHYVVDVEGKIVLRDVDKPFQYLGFTFDGEKILIRPQTLSNFWRRAVGAVKKARDDAASAQAKGRNGRIFRRKLYRRFSHLGQSNFLTYAKRAAKHMEGGSGQYKRAPGWKQIKNHWSKLQRLIESGN